MSDRLTLAKSRTVRLPAEIDGRLQASAAKAGKSVSQLIRQTVEAEYSQEPDTAGNWVLTVGKLRPLKRAVHPARKKFQEAYEKRHR
jgi:predicted DNA-binding protein